ncbi:TIR-NBS-LRR resistance protein [Quillaja saponaria]|uniref:TIR-NBS-LRR resistance protein n=1 Tax=Quillaja saponaria TaxID=32244 RepID=A0AAD7L671_QUISA|nr:TIR-NBS-LRR resistance protein [Quillaja saponaria]
MEEWNSAFAKIEKDQLFYIFEVLILSYDALKQDEKNLFLDIVCFFKGEDLDFVKRIANACGFSADRGIRSLTEKSLVTISNNIIEVHASLQDMVEEIIGHRHQEPGQRSRLWDPEQVHHIFKYNSGTEAVEGIFLDLSKVKDIELRPEAFTRMSNLRLLKLYAPSYHESCKLEKLVELHMPYSNIEELWKGIQGLPRSIHMLNALTYLSLDDCSKFEELPEIFESMARLKSLRLRGTAIQELPLSISHLVGLKTLSLDMCRNLKFLPDINSTLKWLETLSLSGCEKIEKLPRVAGLSSLVELNLSGCCNLLQIPTDIGSLASLSNLSLKGSKIVKIPASIKNLSRLYRLDLTDCTGLEFLPELPPFLQYLYATNCISLEIVSSSKVVLTSHNVTEDRRNNLDNIQLFDFTGCLDLDQESCKNIVVDAQIRIHHMAKLSRKLSRSVTVCFPGNEIPDFFVHRTDGSFISMKLSPGWCNDRFLGFALCVVAEFKGRALEDFRLQCGLKVNNGNIRKQ